MLWLFRSFRPAWPLIWIHCHYICVDIYMSNSQQRLIWCYDPCKLKSTEKATNKTKAIKISKQPQPWRSSWRSAVRWQASRVGTLVPFGAIRTASVLGPSLSTTRNIMWKWTRSLSLFSMSYRIFIFLKKYLSFPINSCDLPPPPVLQKNEPFYGYLFWLIYLLLRRFFREEVKQGPRARV